MKKIYRIVAFVACLVTLVVVMACRTEDPNEETPTVKSGQTIIAFFPWSGNMAATDKGLYTAFLANLSYMQKAILNKGGMGNTRLMVYIERDAYSGDLQEMVYENGVVELKTLLSYHRAAASQSDGIYYILSDIEKLAPAYHYGMIIGGHGCGWTYFSDWQLYPYRMPMRIGTRSFGSYSAAQRAISVETLASNISMAGLHMDFILFDVCYMSNIETAYALRSVTDYIIASPSEIMSFGMPYEQMLTYLMGTPDYDAVCREFYQFYSNYTYPYGTIATINCSEVERMAQLIKSINTYALSTDYELNTIQTYDGFNPRLFYDLGDYVENVCTDTALKTYFLQLLDTLIPYKYHTPMMLTAIGNVRTIALNEYSGITISDPSKNHVAIDGRVRNEWYLATH